MTDLELLRSYDRSRWKCKAMLRACFREGGSLGNIVARLERMGRKPRQSLLWTFGTERAELIPGQIITEFCRRNHIAMTTRQKRTAPQTGVTDEYCQGCIYLTKDYGERICNFLIFEHERRGCPAGTGCKRRKPIRGRKEKS